MNDLGTRDITQHSGNKYLRKIYSAISGCVTCVMADVYCVIEGFAITCPARQHAVKKLLCAGLREKGSQIQDLMECRDALDRAIQMQHSRECREWEVAEKKEKGEIS